MVWIGGLVGGLDWWLGGFGGWLPFFCQPKDQASNPVPNELARRLLSRFPDYLGCEICEALLKVTNFQWFNTESPRIGNKLKS